ncbi:MAG: hydroxymethylbilane synthase [Myxococcota bacterium]|nr:hydroxymethylbilane synthase [Myxococcota bacterium]
MQLYLGTRGSKLAMAQSQQVADAITIATGVAVELVVFQTKGDKILDKPLADIGGKGLFTFELESALLAGEIDFAVHSLKDLPTDEDSHLVIGAIPQREDPRDCIVGKPLRESLIIGTGSLRRESMIRSLSPKAEIRGIRGNVDTRLAKLDRGEFDAIVLAKAGLNRLSIERNDIYIQDPSVFVPAPGQGALGIQCRRSDSKTLEILQSIHHSVTKDCVDFERTFLAAIQGGCNVAAGCYAYRENERYHASYFLDRDGMQRGSITFENVQDGMASLMKVLGV